MDMRRFDTAHPERGWEILWDPHWCVPTARIAHSLTALPDFDVIIMFGGWDGCYVLNDICMSNKRFDMYLTV